MTQILEWIDGQPEFWIYVLVGVSSLIENMFTPMPGDTVTVFGAYLAGIGQANAVGIYLASTLGGTLGFMGLYMIGRLFIKRSERRGKFLGIGIKSIEKVQISFTRWGYWLIVSNRFFYGIRFAVALFAGFAKLNYKKTLAAALVGTAIWNVFLLYLGMVLGENWDTFKVVLWKYNRLILAGVLIGMTAYAIIRYRNKVFRGRRN